MFLYTKKTELINLLFIAFILIQPFLDLLTGLSLRLTESQFSISLLVRAIFVLIAGIYLFLFRGHPNQKKYILYFSVLAAFLLINIGVNYFEKSPFYIASEIKFIFKTIYFIITFFVYWVVFQSLKEEGYARVLKYISISTTVYSLIIFIAGITGTAFQSYAYQKVGHVGWFYAGNDIGVILAMGLPIVLLMAIKHSNFYWIPVLLVIYSLFAIGTKVGYLAILLSLFLALVFVTKDSILNRRKSITTFSGYKIIVLLLLLVGSVLYTPFAPIAENMGIHLSILETKKEAEAPKHMDPVDKEHSDKETDKEEVKELIYSGRTSFLKMYNEYFEEAPMSQKMFGMGYAGNYSESPKLIEMDYHDIFYSFGMVGFLIYFAPLLYFIYRAARELITRFSSFFKYENILILTGCALGLGIAFMAGHVLTAPSVSYFLAILISLILVKYK